MSYTRNFGMRGFENIVRIGRFKTPTNATWNIGASVEADPANAGQLKLAPAGTGTSALAGAVVYEHIQYQGTDPFLSTPFDPPYTTVPAGRYAQVIHGPGTKVFFKNSVDKTLYDGRTQTGVQVLSDGAGTGAGHNIDVSTLSVGDYLTPDGAGGWKKANGTTDGNWLQVESTNTSTGLVEARFAF